jgi:hypothetical protein
MGEKVTFYETKRREMLGTEQSKHFTTETNKKNG